MKVLKTVRENLFLTSSTSERFSSSASSLSAWVSARIACGEREKVSARIACGGNRDVEERKRETCGSGERVRE